MFYSSIERKMSLNSSTQQKCHYLQLPCVLAQNRRNKVCLIWISSTCQNRTTHPPQGNGKQFEHEPTSTLRLSSAGCGLATPEMRDTDPYCLSRISLLLFSAPPPATAFVRLIPLYLPETRWIAQVITDSCTLQYKHPMTQCNDFQSKHHQYDSNPQTHLAWRKNSLPSIRGVRPTQMK